MKFITHKPAAGKAATSPSSRGRGLKYKALPHADGDLYVALFTRAWIEIKPRFALYLLAYVALFTRAWIEISRTTIPDCRFSVALFTRAWIEIHNFHKTITQFSQVALFTRAWIEIHLQPRLTAVSCVALFTRAWIEIFSP